MPPIAFPPIEWNPRVELRIFGPLFLAGCLLLCAPWARRFLANVLRPWIALGLLALAATALLVYLAAILAAPFFVDQSEYGVANISWWWASGHPMYPEPGTTNIRDLYPYGPLTFEIIGVTMRIMGPGVLAPKLPGLIASAAGFICAFHALKRLGAGNVLVRGFLGAVFIVARATWVQARLDPVCSAFTAIALLVATFRPSIRTFGAIGILAGLSFGLKIHGFLYILPALALLATRGEARAAHWTACALAAVVLAATPFFVAGVDAGDYVRVLADASRDGLAMGIFISNIVFVGMFMLAPRLLHQRDRTATPPGGALTLHQEHTLTWTLALCALFVSVIASKPLAGPHHLLPFLVYVGPLVVAARQRSGNDFQSVAAPMLVFLVLAFQPVSEMIKVGKQAAAFWDDSIVARDLVAELRARDDGRPIAFCNPGGQARWFISRFDEPTTLSIYAVFGGAQLGKEHSPISGPGLWVCADDHLPRKLPANCAIEKRQGRFSVIACMRAWARMGDYRRDRAVASLRLGTAVHGRP